MKRIIIATDFSPAALNAAYYAVEMALVIKADIILLHVCQLSLTYGESHAIINENYFIEGAEEELDKLNKHLAKHTDQKLLITNEVRVGAFYYELKALCDSVEPVAVVMGSQGTTTMEHILVGRHAIYAMHHLEYPLITVPPEARFSTIKKIGIACDLNKVIDYLPLAEIKAIIKDFNAELHVLNIAVEDYDPNAVFESGMLLEMLYSMKPQFHFINNKNIDAGIIEYADRHNIDLLIVIPKRHGLLEQIFHKSHTKGLVLHSHVPVLSLHK